MFGSPHCLKLLQWLFIMGWRTISDPHSKTMNRQQQHDSTCLMGDRFSRSDALHLACLHPSNLCCFRDIETPLQCHVSCAVYVCVYRPSRQRFRIWRTRSRSCTEIWPSTIPSSTQIKWERSWTGRCTLTARYLPSTPLWKLWESCLKRCVRWYLDVLTYCVYLPLPGSPDKKKSFYICPQSGSLVAN